MDQEKSEFLVVRLPLTEKDRRTAAAAEQGVPADIALVFAAVARALGTPVPDGDLERVGWVHPLHLQELLNSSDREKFAVTSKVRIGSRDIALVRLTDAESLIAARNALIQSQGVEIIRTGTQLAAARAANGALHEQIARLTAERDHLAASQPSAERDGLKANMFWDVNEGENGANHANIVMENYDPFEQVKMQTGFFGPNIWGFHDGTNSFVFDTEAECRASIDAAMAREGQGDA